VNGDPLDTLALQVLARYPLLAGCSPRPLGNRGGFSGARLWRLDAPAGPAYLRAWPEWEMAARHEWIHGLMEDARTAGLDFVPEVFRAHTGSTVVEHAGRCWEAGTWLPGVADYHAHPSPGRLQNACRALARLHLTWDRETTAPLAPIPAILRRRQALHAALELVTSGSQPADDPLDPALPAARRAWVLLSRWLPSVPDWLDRWATRSLPLQPCLTDVWHDHILFTGDTVTGLVDYGGVQVDHPTADLARALGSLVEDDAHSWSLALAAYAEVRRLSPDDGDLARDLDRSGTVLSLARWQERLYGPGSAAEDRRAAAHRLEELVRRVEGWGLP
jgi:Ser/Thr protein kinase RdoA (MazF antagonist)